MHNDEPRMELRALIAVILSMAVLAAYQFFFVPAAPPEGALPDGLETSSTPAPSQVATPATPLPARVDNGPEAGATAAAVAAEKQSQVSINAENYRATLTNQGGRLTSMILSGYRDDFGDELDLVSAAATSAARFPFEWVSPLGAADAEILNNALFTVAISGGSAASSGSNRTVTPDSPVIVRFDWADGTGRSAWKEIIFPADGNMVSVEAGVTGFNNLFLGLGAGLDEVPVGLRNAYLAENAMVYGASGLEKWSASDLEAGVGVDGPSWAGTESHYFMAVYLLDSDDAALSRVLLTAVPVQVPAAPDAEDENPVDHVVPATAVAIESFATATPVYFGPKKYDELVEQGHALEQAVDFGMWGFVSRPLLFVLNMIYSFVRNWGIAIILLTALLRLAFWPLNQKAMTSMRKTQKLQPQMAAIRGKYKGVKDLDKRQKMNEEVMALYKREGVSPLGGCLPMVAQIPILFSFYALLSVAIELRQAPFVFWITDLSRHDPYLVLPLLMGASMLVQQRLTPQATADPQQASMMRMMRLMPIFFTVMFLYVPSGLVLYWLVNNLLGIGQQLYVNRSMDRQLLAEKAAKKANKAAKTRGNSQRGE